MMASSDSTYFFKAKMNSYKPCICNLKDCAAITKSFRDIKDIRGEMKKLPNSKAGSRKVKIAEFNNFYLRRVVDHRNTALERLAVQEHGQDGDDIIKKDVHVAMWHFDKSILCAQEDGFKFIKNAMSLKEATELGIYHSAGGTLYSNADKYEKENEDTVVTLVPTVFDTGIAYCDLAVAREEKRRRDIIDEAKIQLSKSEHLRSARSKRQKSKNLPDVSISASASSETVNSRGKRAKKKQKSKTKTNKKIKTAAPVTNIKMLTNAKFFKLRKKEQSCYLNQLRHDLAAFKKDYKRAELSDLLDQKNVLTAALIRQEEINESKMKEWNKIKMLSQNQLELKRHLEILENEAGLNRYSLTAKDGAICSDRNLCEQLYGFEDFEYMIDFIEAAFEIKYTEPNYERCHSGTQKGQNMLTDVEQVLLTLVFTNTRWSYDVIGLMFGIKANTVSKFIKKWMPLLGERGDMMSHFLPFLNKEAYDELLPESYQEIGLNKVAALVDGKDFLAETVRVDRVLNCAQASNKMHASAFRVLTWSLPCGAVIERTPAFLARASEKGIMSAWGKHKRLLFPVGYLILGDKGFDNTAGCYVNYNTTLHPSFLTNKQFNNDQINHNTYISKKRYSCEVVYSRVTRVAKLSGIYRREWFHYFESIVGWAHGRANLCYGYLQE